MNNNDKKCFRNISNKSDFLTAVRNTSTDQGGKFKRDKLITEDEENSSFIYTIEYSEEYLTEKGEAKVCNQRVSASDNELKRLMENLALFGVKYMLIECK